MQAESVSNSAYLDVACPMESTIGQTIGQTENFKGVVDIDGHLNISLDILIN